MDNKKYFDNVVKNGGLNHAYLFHGPDSVEKMEFAEYLFKLVNGRESKNDPDFKIITPRIEEEETKIYIEDMRELKSFLSLKPYYGPYKLVVINDAHCLTTEASNAILKVLEEPSPSSVLILLAPNPKLLIPTVVSRCESVQFLSLGKKKIKDDMKKDIDEFRKKSKEGIYERLQYAENLFKKGDYRELVVDLIHTLHSEHNQKTHVLRGLLRLNYLLSQPQFNHRLALENFLINL